MENILFLLLSVALSTGRNVITKKNALSVEGKASFYLSQTFLFASASVLLAVFSVNELADIKSITLICGLVYGVLLIISQWMLTSALSLADTSVCSVIYSLGFLLPTLSGVAFFGESIGVYNIIGIAVAVAVILLAVKKSDRTQKKERSFIPFILTAMLASGGLGIMQKLQQSTSAAEQKVSFLTVGFLFATFGSIVALLICRQRVRLKLEWAAYPILTGLCFGGANYFNTVLAGKMASAVFFPLQNISTILSSTLLGLLFFKEKFTVKTVFILILGIAVVVLLSI